jgi:tetratricopeptide (TPR) repeat protein
MSNQWVDRHVLAALLVLTPYCLYGQLNLVISQCRIPQAQSGQELNAFLNLFQKSQPEETLQLTLRFIESFPKSEFLGQVYLVQMKVLAGQELFKEAVVAGRKAVELNPRDVEVLLNLARLLALYSAQSENPSVLLTEAEQHAKRALEETPLLRADRRLSLTDWQNLRDKMEASAYFGLGLVSFERENYAESVSAIETAIALNPWDQGELYCWLGKAFMKKGQLNQARGALERAVDLGPEAVRLEAARHLSAIKLPCANSKPR